MYSSNINKGMYSSKIKTINKAKAIIITKVKLLTILEEEEGHGRGGAHSGFLEHLEVMP